MTPTYALFADPDHAQQAVDRLHDAGIPDRNIVVMSSEPMEDHAFGARDAATWMHWIAAAGGALGLAAAVSLLVYAQTAWPIVTSAMPIVSWWPNLIIMFEMTMLGAILATVATLVVTAMAPGKRRARFYDRAVGDGYILVGVDETQDDPRIAAVLSSCGGELGRDVQHEAGRVAN